MIANAADTAKFDDVEGDYTRIAVGGPVAGWHSYADAYDVASAGPFDRADRRR